MPPKVREVIRRLESEDWELVRQRGSHRRYRRPGNPYVVTVAGKPNEVMAAGTWNEIQRKAGWK
jgi:predicted RNA binding protein YcfA (HicA-like mRNA interferase family)